ncbi:serine/threonine-protein kinase [Micromonospora sp. RV43]|uniref:serine/threonine-protein kinase n=1 Tax=Micromonospora sp. RV43 TaxID=1661387 RepID=UPI00064BC035|nr:serine/threonine-protein kinase [Micromonospora sp. RV43]
MLGPGVKLGNRYRLDERIASGGMGDVWRGTDQVLGRTVAVKSLLPALLDEPGFAERFRGEARTMATINHPGVVDVYDFGSDQHIAFLVMEYVEGDALSATLSRVGRLTPARTMALLAQAADALHAAHEKGIVHRDVKPGNLLVRPNGTLVLTDFGIARSDLVGQLTAAGSVLGTASYISPEQATGAVATPASDVYALGVVAYQCLAGRRPFEGDNPLEIAMKHVRDTPRALPADIPPQVRAIVERAMAKDPAARWPSAAALASIARQAKLALSQAARSGHPISGVPASPAAPVAYARPPAAAPPRRSRSGLWTTAIVVAVLVILCSGVISFLYRKYGATASASASVSVTSGAVQPYGGDYPVRTSYRREVRLLPAGGGTTTSEGRETR